MSSLRRIVMMAEMHGRDLTLRHVALGLLVALPLSFYLASMGKGHDADRRRRRRAGVRGLGRDALLGALVRRRSTNGSSSPATGPTSCCSGRLAFLGPLGLADRVRASRVLMSGVSHPERPWLTFVGVAAVALMSIPFGLAVGAVVPRELEGTLVLIGVVGLQLAASPSSPVARVLPFYGPRQLIAAGVGLSDAILGPLLLTLAYAIALLVVARLLMARRVGVTRHPRDHHDSRGGRHA